MEFVETLARIDGARGEVVLRRRELDGLRIEELIVNGAFAMDSRESRTERELARLAVDGDGRRRILVGGLGLGYTALALLATDVEVIDVVELEPDLVGWARSRLTATLAAVVADPRVRLWVGDISDVLGGTTDGPSGPWDAVLLDVDNGPDFLIHPANARLYAEPALRAAYARVAPGGVLVVWSQGPAPALLAALRRLDGESCEHVLTVEREGRVLAYALYTLTRQPERTRTTTPE